MRIDNHLHHRDGFTTGADLLTRLNAAGLDGAVVLSESPYASLDSRVLSPRERLDRVMRYTEGHDTLYPFFWIDPTDDDASDQVDMAIEAGVWGFKTICTHFYPNDPRAVKTYRKIAETGKPYLFHSGILYDGTNASGDFNRPCNFEVLLSIPHLKFALAHISWPWCDECIAVFGKFCNYLERSGDKDAPEMFVDLTPGTPPLYRRDAIAKLMGMEGAKDHILWGVDSNSANYQTDYASQIRTRDEAIFQDLGYGNNFIEDICYPNLKRFLGL